jgi:outer membrane receptor for ferrienterochelin and colicins
MKYFVLLASFLLISALSAQPATLVVTVNQEDSPLEFALVRVLNTSISGMTDSLGRLTLALPDTGRWSIEASYVGYSTKVVQIKAAMKAVSINLQPIMQQEVVVSGTMRAISRTNSPIPVNILSAQLFRNNANPVIFDNMALLSGVQPVINCSVCQTGDFQINGMPGVYTQVLIDGMPIVSGLGTVYGLMGIPSAMLDRIEVVKGPAGSLYGPESMAGQINIITKSPDQSPALSMDYSVSSWAEHNLDLGLRFRPGKKVSALLGVSGFSYQNPVDNNADGFTDLALQQRLSVFNKWSWDEQLQLAGRFVREDRWGGDMAWTKADLGGDVIYGEFIETQRSEWYGSWRSQSDNPLHIQGSYNTHRQDSYYGTTPYAATQRIGFIQAYVDKQQESRHILAGAALRHTYYDDNTPATEQAESRLLPGLFVQEERKLKGGHTLLGGLRADWHREHGIIWTPRVASRFRINDQQQVRASIGSGFRVVQLFTEDHAALSGSRAVIIAEALQPERSWSAQMNYLHIINRGSHYLELDMSAFYTLFSNRILPDYDTNPEQIIYANLEGRSVSRGLTLLASYANDFPLSLNAGVTYMQVFVQEADRLKTQQVRAPRWSGTLAASYTHPRSLWSFSISSSWYGPQRMPVLENDFRPEYAPFFALINGQLSKKLKHHLEIYGGVRNLLNFIPRNPIMRPEDPFDRNVDDAVNNPFGYTFDTAYQYAPMQGIRVYVGCRVHLDGRKAKH